MELRIKEQPQIRGLKSSIFFGNLHKVLADQFGVIKDAFILKKDSLPQKGTI